MRDDQDIIERKSLLEQLLELAAGKKSGFLTVGDQDYVSYFRVMDGTLAAAHWQVDGEFFTSHVAASGLVSERMLKKAARRSLSRHQSLAQSISQEGGPLPGRFRELMREAIQEEIWRLAGQEDVWWQFSDVCDEVEFDPNLLALNMQLTIEFIVVEIAGRQGDEVLLDHLLPERMEVLVPEERCRRYFDGSDSRYDEERQIVVLIDGERDVEEILAESPLAEFRTLQLLHRFKTNQEVRPLNPAELIQVATVFKARGRFDKCLRLYLRAEEMGNQAFDLDLTIGSIYETIGQQDEAYDRYVTFADRCLNAGDRKAGHEAFERALALRPSNIELREKHLEILDPLSDRERYVRETRTFLGLAKSVQDHARTQNALRSLIKIGEAESDDVRAFISLLVRERGAREAFQDLRKLALDLLADERFAEARGVLEAAAEIRPNHVDVLEGLAQVYSKEGDEERAIEAFESLIHALRREDLNDAEREGKVRSVYARLFAFAPRHPAALQYEAREALAKGDRETAGAHLRKLASVRRESSDTPRLTAVLKRLRKVCPDDTEMLTELADCHFAAGRVLRGAEAQRAAAERLGADERTHRQAEVLYEELLQRVPFDVEALEGLAALHERSRDRIAHRRTRVRLANAYLATDRGRDAGEVFLALAGKDTSDSESVRRAAMYFIQTGAADDLAERVVTLTRRLVSLRDFGLASALVDAVGNPDSLRSILDQGPKRVEARPATPAAPTPPPISAPPAPPVATPPPAPSPSPAAPSPPTGGGVSSIAAAKAKLAQLKGRKVDKHAPDAPDAAGDIAAAGGLKSEFKKEKKTKKIPASLKASMDKLRGMR